ncbi:helix-turn-helix transcriptional regulator [Clostridium senegalense]
MSKLKKIRKEKDLTLRQLSKLSDVAAGYISDLENGRRKNPSFETMQKLSKALNKTVQDIFF